MVHHNFSLADLENMLPWERELYLVLMKEHIEEENRKIRNDKQKWDKNLWQRKHKKVY